MNDIEKIITPSNLKSDLEIAEKSGDLRMIILYANLYNEYFINLLYKFHLQGHKIEVCDKCGKPKVPKFKQKVEKLSTINIVAKEYGHDNLISLIFELRNELAHNLVYNIKELEERFGGAEADPSMEDETGLITNFLRSASPLEKIKLMVFATVTTLYHKYEQMNGRTPEQTIHFEINPEGTRVQIVIKPY